MFTPPSRAALPIFTDEDSKPHAGATVAVFVGETSCSLLTKKRRSLPPGATIARARN
jgi:hypothetical protein